uniref:protein-tyrosine-phosphatase n=1 Tax=Strigamia maritima TaxID=126957 RepID=T1JEW4_STRMM
MAAAIWTSNFRLGKIIPVLFILATLPHQFCSGLIAPVTKKSGDEVALKPLNHPGNKYDLDDMIDQVKIDTGHSKIHKVDLVSDEYKFVIRLEIPSGTLDPEMISKTRKMVAAKLDVAEENVRISHVDITDSSIEMYVVYTALDSLQRMQGVNVLIPASQVLPHLTPKELESYNRNIPIKSISGKIETKDEAARQVLADAKMWKVFQKQIWETWQLPFLIASTLIFVLVLVVVFLFLCFRQQIDKKLADEEQTKHMCVFPDVKPCIKNTDPVQPDGATVYMSEDDLKVIKTEPLRVRAKGLLERRGSNTSLTIELNPSPESSITYSSPSRESNCEEFLLSAGNRMSRKQLRGCIKDVKTLHNEFWDIPMNHPDKVEVAGSGTKNRYKTIIPNDLTRVKLPENPNDSLSTYINANYIRGYDSEENAYIAAQGPMVHTIEDFWLMVWQEKSPMIIMITKLKEKNKIKCEPYIPNVRATYGAIEVTTTKVSPREGYTVRDLFLRNGNQCHQVQHFWFTAWPDHKTPATPKQLVAMAVEVESHRCDNNGRSCGPIVIHCSAGIGRTGCFIAISIGMQQLMEENMLDVLGIVCAMRLDRGGMIQTAEQYEFVHRALIDFDRSLPEVAGD